MQEVKSISNNNHNPPSYLIISPTKSIFCIVSPIIGIAAFGGGSFLLFSGIGVIPHVMSIYLSYGLFGLGTVSTISEAFIIKSIHNDLNKSEKDIDPQIRRAFRFFISSFGKKQSDPKRYFFTQQVNNSCHISPFRNIELLRSLRENDFDLSESEFKTRRQWLGENQKMLFDWHILLKEICTDEGAAVYPNFYKYITQGIENAPILPHFYDKRGNRPFTGISGLLEFSQLPYFLIDIDDLLKVHFKIGFLDISFEKFFSKDDLGVKTAFVRSDDTYQIYNLESREFESIEEKEWVTIEQDDTGKTIINIDHDKISKEDLTKYPIPPSPYSTITMCQHAPLGLQEIGVILNLGDGLNINEKTYVPFQMSLMKLIFFAAGVDENNEVISEEHPLFKAFQEFRNLLDKKTDGYWHPDKLKKEDLMQYQLARIFKENPELFEKAEATVDSLFSFYDNYKKTCNGVFYNSSLAPYQNSEQFLLGREQTVAYYFMQNIRMAWYSSINPEVYLKAQELGLPIHIAGFVHENLVKKLNKKHTVAESQEKISFLEVWEELVKKLNELDRTDFVSFDDHGWVVSLDKNLIDLQNNKTVYNKSLLERLEIAGVESWWGSELGLWYSKVDEDKSL